MRILAVALAVSIAVHLVLLALPVHPPGVIRPAALPLRVTLPAPLPATDPVPRPVPSSSSSSPSAAPASPAVTRLPPAAALTLPYLPAGDVDELPRALDPIDPDPPEEARRHNLAGEVRLLLFINAAGGVDDVVVQAAIPPGVFDEAARHAFAAARFQPARRGGQPVAVQLPVVLHFDPPEEKPADRRPKGPSPLPAE